MNDTDYVKEYKPDHIDMDMDSTTLYWGNPEKRVLKFKLSHHEAVLEVASTEEGVKLIGKYDTYLDRDLEKIRATLSEEITKLKATL
jgi:hypothetical protein